MRTTELSASPVADALYPGAATDSPPPLEAFLARNTSRKVVCIQGLGFVGSVMALVCADANNGAYAVIGVDLPNPTGKDRIRGLNEGRFPIAAADPLIQELHSRSLMRGNFLATHDAGAFAHADVIIVDVNLDVAKRTGSSGELFDFDVHLDGFERAIEAIGQHAREGVLVLVETTVPPGTCQHLVKPILDAAFARRGLSSNYLLGHSYERVMPGPEYVQSISSFPRAFAGIDGASAQAVEQFLRTIIDTRRAGLTRLGSTTATEMAKVLENSYRAANIAFLVEWSRYAEEAGVDLYEIVHAIRERSTHRNLMLPGIGVGGYCLTKDPLLASWSRRNIFGSGKPLPVSEQSVSINDQMPRAAFDRLASLHGKLEGERVAILGVSYRGEVGDTRFTPVERFVDYLEAAGAHVECHDPYVRFWEERQEHIHSQLEPLLESDPAVVAICTGHSEYGSKAVVSRLMACKPMLIFDTVGALSREAIAELACKHQVSVLGRGDSGAAA